jgi:opacity protein-like surface antigen
MRRVIALLTLIVLAMAVPAMAQDPDKKVTVNFGGGYTFALSEVRNHLGDGYNFHFGVGIKLNDMLTFQPEYSFNGLGEKQVTLPAGIVPPGQTAVTDVFGSMNVQWGAFNLVIGPKAEAGKAHPYFVVGPGVYYRKVEATTPSVGYIPPYCDPWWGWCYPGGLVPVDKVLGSESMTSFGMNFGAGVSFPMGDSASFYIEARYHYIWGSDVTDSSGKSYGKANGQFFPITGGIRF